MMTSSEMFSPTKFRNERLPNGEMNISVCYQHNSFVTLCMP